MAVRRLASLVFLVALLAAVLLPASVVSAAPGDSVSSGHFSLNGFNGSPSGITWNGSYYFVTDYEDDKVYYYEADGVFQGSFAVADGPTGITWNGNNLFVVRNHGGSQNVCEYTSSGSYVSCFSLGSDHLSPTGITWDGNLSLIHI